MASPANQKQMRYCIISIIASLIFGQQAAATETITIRTQDGANIAAQLYGSGPRGVVLAHGGRFTKEDWVPQADFLAAHGFRVLAFDFRGFGESPRHGRQWHSSAQRNA